MTYDRSTFKQIAAEKHSAADERRAEFAQKMRQLSQAEVSHEALMADPHWRVYQQLLQGAIEQTKKDHAELLQLLDEPELTDENEIRRIRNLMFMCKARITAWEVAISLPKQVQEHGAEARQWLDEHRVA